MTAEQQLERSVLERKEREELRAIAQAMSLQTNSRSKKADIIDSILRPAGVEVVGATTSNKVNGAEPRPRRKAAATTSDGPEDSQEDRDAGESKASVEVETAPSNGRNGSSSSKASSNGA